jgi:RNA polymerase sigma-70 factor (ECF subfamily)
MSEQTFDDFAALHQAYRGEVLRYLTRLVGAADAEDLTQLVMLKVSDGLGGFRDESTISTWIYRIATNAAIDWLRRRGSQPPTEEVDDEAVESQEDTATVSTEAAAVREEMSTCIREFVSRLPENYRTVMVLSEIEGFKNEEIAAILDITLDTVKIRLHRARERLRSELKRGCSFDRDAGGELACDRKPTTASLHPRR